MCKTLLIAILGFTMVNCGGGNNNTIRIVWSMVKPRNSALKTTVAMPVAPSSNGIYNLPIVCSAGFANTGGLADALVVTVTDVNAIHQSLGSIHQHYTKFAFDEFHIGR
ncbi:MAG: hypothetical protein R2877_04590 [Bdellovibrionota bacterium]